MLAVLPASPLFAFQTGGKQLEEALAYEGQKITSLTFEPEDQPLSRAELQKRVTLPLGSVFHEKNLRLALQNLYASGRYGDLAVDAHQDAAGVALRFVTQRAYFVGRVEIHGAKDPPNQGQLISAAKLRLGTPFSNAQKDQAAESIEALLRQNGFYNAAVETRVNYEPQFEEAHLTFEIDPGPRAHLELPSISGNKIRSTSSVIRSTHWRRLYGFLGLGWRPVTDSRIRGGLDNIRRSYERLNLLESKVTLSRLDYHEDSNTVEPFIDIKEGTRVEVRINGARVSRGKLLELVPVFQESSIDADLLVEGDHNLEKYLQSEGYFEAEVSHSVTDGKTSRERIITYDVDRGPHHKLVFLGISGNHYFNDQMIRERLQTEVARLPRFPYGRFSEGIIQQDVQAVQNLYASNGFREAKVTSHIEDDYQGRSNHLAVFIQIKEGSQSFVANVTIEGAEQADTKTLRDMLASSSNQVFSDASIALDRENILNYYYGRGYLNATFEYYVTNAAEPQHYNLRYVVKPGPRSFVRSVLVTGRQSTSQSLVFNRIELKDGEPLSLAKEIDTQRRLYDLGIFARVNSAIQNPDSDEADKYVLYDLDEARHYSFTLGLGAQITRIGGGSITSLNNPVGSEGFSPRIALGVSRINLFGLGQTIGIQTAASTPQQRVALSYFIPTIISNDKLSFTASALLEHTNDIHTFTAVRREGSIQLSERISRAFAFQYRLTYRHITLSQLKINSGLVPILQQPETAGLASFSIIQDKRDDPADAHHGLYTTIDLTYAPGFLGSQTHFARGQIRNSTYHPFKRDFVFARTTEFGVIQRSGGKDNIPLAERFYSGGSTSLRAFPDFQAGPRDTSTGFVLGGNALFVNSFELRFPLFGDNLGGVLFQDAGNVYDSINSFSFRFRQQTSPGVSPNTYVYDFNYMVQSAGFGIRYKTPLGPFRLDFSISPNAPRFRGLKGTLADYLNNPTGLVPVTQKINAFQFHLTLGQAF